MSLNAQTESLISEFADDADMVELIEMFVDELPDRVAAIEKAVSDQDLENLRALAHQLKGAAGGYGFPTITDAAEFLESSVKTNQAADQVKQQIDVLADLCGRAMAKPA